MGSVGILQSPYLTGESAARGNGICWPGSAVFMVEATMIDLKALLVEREDCDAGTVQQIRNALGQGGGQFRALREATEAIRKKMESASGTSVKRWHLKLGIALFFLGHTSEATGHLEQAEGAL